MGSPSVRLRLQVDRENGGRSDQACKPLSFSLRLFLITVLGSGSGTEIHLSQVMVLLFYGLHNGDKCLEDLKCNYVK